MSGLAAEWWFWALAAIALAGGWLLVGRDYGERAARTRAWAVRRGWVELPPGRTLGGASRAGSLAWLALPASAWVALGPWIWGYDDVSGAVTTDVVTGVAVFVIALAGMVLPALWTLNLVAGVWLVIAPWVVGYGDADGPVGLSDAIAGIVISVAAVAALVGAERQVVPGSGRRALGRVRTRD